MRQTNPIRSRAALAALALVTTILTSGCFNPFSPLIAPVRGNVPPPPTPNSAPGVLRLFEWCYNNREIAEYREIFTDDYRFIFSPQDSSGGPYRGVPWTREDELISTTQLFVGGGVESPASTIQLTLDKNFVVLPDGLLAPWDVAGRWHKTITTQVQLSIRTSDGNAIDISGAALFYFVRGDSAVIPDELKRRGFGPDSTRWYIRRWDDQTVQPGPGGEIAWSPATARRARPAAAQPAPIEITWGTLKASLLQQALANGP
ncbi:MAG: hypothetical protein HY076_05330 [Candidatus Eisenbacteria bacterium]|uniref:Uncharacterized protein n=1 Tax=Eiseniibacteriota bacterium TaxID=2212470 RepID=A0A9D6QJW0_UNCEI|nr:hypothetical protein [Candidatus Eisenbacteria bacterium]MBI3539675.1 hypothetical protein [Candidatus Eisenbacteria bacterium]